MRLHDVQEAKVLLSLKLLQFMQCVYEWQPERADDIVIIFIASCPQFFWSNSLNIPKWCGGLIDANLVLLYSRHFASSTFYGNICKWFPQTPFYQSPAITSKNEVLISKLTKGHVLSFQLESSVKLKSEWGIPVSGVRWYYSWHV